LPRPVCGIKTYTDTSLLIQNTTHSCFHSDSTLKESNYKKTSRSHLELNNAQHSISDGNVFYRYNNISTENNDEANYIENNVTALALTKQPSDRREYKPFPKSLYSNCLPPSSSSTTRSTLHPSSCLTQYQDHFYIEKRHSFGSSPDNISSLNRTCRQDSLKSMLEISSNQMDPYYPNHHGSGLSSGTSSVCATGDSSNYGMQSNLMSYRNKGTCHADQTTKY
jgi:hypothetical protein